MPSVRRVLPFLVAALVFPFAAVSVAAAPAACPTAWEPATVHDTAVDFFPHLTPGQFETAEELEAAIASTYDKDADGNICIKHQWGYDLNPNSHWYQVGFELGLNEPVHVIQLKDDRP
jgi:hypothetical protein